MNNWRMIGKITDIKYSSGTSSYNGMSWELTMIKLNVPTTRKQKNILTLKVFQKVEGFNKGDTIEVVDYEIENSAYQDKKTQQWKNETSIVPNDIRLIEKAQVVQDIFTPTQPQQQESVEEDTIDLDWDKPQAPQPTTFNVDQAVKTIEEQQPLIEKVFHIPNENQQMLQSLSELFKKIKEMGEEITPPQIKKEVEFITLTFKVSKHIGGLLENWYQSNLPKAEEIKPISDFIDPRTINEIMNAKMKKTELEDIELSSKNDFKESEENAKD